MFSADASLARRPRTPSPCFVLAAGHPARLWLDCFIDELLSRTSRPMHSYTAVVERCADTGLYVGYIPGFPGAHTQAETLDELDQNLREVLELLLEDGEPQLQAEFVGTHTVTIAA
jgi:predicted RNase H-like HicB family nuclease